MASMQCPRMEHSAWWRWWVFKLPNEEEAIFWFGVTSWFSFEKVLSFVGAFTQGVTLDMVGIFPMCLSIRFNN
jgi:hypothetical protein